MQVKRVLRCTFSLGDLHSLIKLKLSSAPDRLLSNKKPDPVIRFVSWSGMKEHDFCDLEYNISEELPVGCGTQTAQIFYNIPGDKLIGFCLEDALERIGLEKKYPEEKNFNPESIVCPREAPKTLDQEFCSFEIILE